MEYNLKDNGDLLEKQNAEFIEAQFPTYQSVWKLYIGNIGDDTKASITGYPAERENKRQAFSEHTYTVLQSLVLIKRLVEKNAFDSVNVKSLDDKLNLQDNIILFFTHIGRIRDNATVAAECLMGFDVKKIETQLDEFYHKRHISVHGRVMPLVYYDDGKIEMPILSKNDEDPKGWNHKVHNWPAILSTPLKSVSATTTQIFWQLLPVLTDIFGKFEKHISDELAKGGFKLNYEIIKSGVSGRSGTDGLQGSSGHAAINVYGIKEIPNINTSGSYRGR